MTRELKLALIVGFAIVLTVAILVSDHLSKARQASLADVGAVNATRVSAKLPDEPIKSPDELLPATLTPAMNVTEPTLTRRDESAESTGAMLPPSREPQIATTESVQPPVVIGLGTAAGQTTLPETVSEDVTSARRELVQNAPSGTAAANQDSSETIAKHSPVADQVLSRADERKTESAPQSSPAKPSALPIGPNDRTHTVAENESLYAISKRYYGSGNLWRQLAAANVGRVGENGAARTGTRIVIPPKDVLLGKTETKSATRNETRSATKPEPKTSGTTVKATNSKPANDKARTYTVKPGDSLGRIAARELGSSKRLGEIAALNKMDPDDDLLAGAILKLPAR